MSKPGAPKAGHDGVPEKIVEIDAIDGAEWERDQHTPQAPVAGLAALVRQTVPQPVRIEPKHKQTRAPRPHAQPAQAQAPQPQPQQAKAPQPQQAQAPQAQPPEAQSQQPHPPLGPSEPTKLRSRPPRPPAKSAPSVPAADLAPAVSSVAPAPAPAHASLQLGPAGPQHLAPEVVQLPLNAPPSEPITTPALVIPRPFIVEAEQRLRAQPDHTPAPPAPLAPAPPPLDSFESPAHTGSDAPGASTDALAGAPDVPALRPRFASRRVIALAGVTAAAIIAVVVVAATRSSTPSGPSAPTKTGEPSSRVVAQVKLPEPAPPTPAEQPSPPSRPSRPPEATPTTAAAQPSPPAPPTATEHAVAAHEPAAPRSVPRLRDEPLASPASPRPHRLRPAPSFRGTRKASKAVAVRPAVHQEPADPVDDEPSVSRARVAYDAGNQALFAGDSAAAVRAYRQVLAYVPTYAAGFRGLGLAHAQQGDLGAAIMALRTYLTLAPSARDVALIKKRIAILQAASATERSAQRSDR